MPVTDDRGVLYLYLDESGNLDFSEHGTRYFLMTCVLCRRPFVLAERLAEFRYDCLEEGIALEKFHACDDTNPVRVGVYERIAEEAGGLQVVAAAVDKASLSEGQRTGTQLYALAFDAVMSTISFEGASRVVAITDRLPQMARRRDVYKPLKASMTRCCVERGIPYVLLSQPSACDFNLQVADYVCWAVHRAWNHGAEWPLNKIREGMNKFLVIEKRGDALAPPPRPSGLSKKEEPLGFVSVGGNLCCVDDTTEDNRHDRPQRGPGNLSSQSRGE